MRNQYISDVSSFYRHNLAFDIITDIVYFALYDWDLAYNKLWCSVLSNVNFDIFGSQNQIKWFFSIQKVPD
jgi:hypothetical protein